MMSDEERERRKSRKLNKEFIEIYQRLSPWNQFRVRIRLYGLFYIQQIKKIPVRWVKSQMQLDDDIRRHGMPFKVKLQLEKWFNYPPHNDDKYFLNQDRKIWYHCFAEEDNLELHLYYKGRYPGHIWLQPEKDGTATIIGIHIREGFRNTGLGTMAFQEAVSQIRDQVNCIKGVLEKEYYPDPELSLRWLRRQGFDTKEMENGDYALELWLK